MDEIERQTILKELNKLNKDLSSYKSRQEKHISTKFTNGQIKNLRDLRARIWFNHRDFKKHISEYGGTATIKIASISYDVFEYSLRKISLNELPPQLFTAVDKAQDIVSKASKNIGAIPKAQTDWREIKVKEDKKEANKEIAPISVPTQLHPKILEVSQSLFETGHYSQAIFEAYKAVNNFVKEKTGLSLDGKDLMVKVFREKTLSSN